MNFENEQNDFAGQKGPPVVEPMTVLLQATPVTNSPEDQVVDPIIQLRRQIAEMRDLIISSSQGPSIEGEQEYSTTHSGPIDAATSNSALISVPYASYDEVGSSPKQTTLPHPTLEGSKQNHSDVGQRSSAMPTYGKKCWFLVVLVVLVVVVAAIAATVVVVTKPSPDHDGANATASNQADGNAPPESPTVMNATIKPSLQPTLSPASSIPSASPTGFCNAQTACVTSELSEVDSQSCLQCIQQAINTTLLASCNTFLSGACPALKNCSACGSCIDDMETFAIQCTAGVPQNCTDSCQPEYVSDQCGKQETDFGDCVSYSGVEMDTCVECANKAIISRLQDSCDPGGFCADFGSCNSPCKDCLDELEALIDCEIGSGCDLNCTERSIFPNTRLCAEDLGDTNADGYQICLDLNIPEEDVVYFENARTLWTSVITEDLQSVNLTDFDPSYACSSFPSIVDDMYLCAQYQDLDGYGGIWARSFTSIVRTSNSLPVLGVIEIDQSEAQVLRNSGVLQEIVTRHVGWSLGFDVSSVFSEFVSTYNDGCQFLGGNATREWQALTNCTTLPTLASEGASCLSNWDETCFDNELMTRNNVVDFKISRVTIGALQDAGYTVNYTVGDNFTVSDLNPSCVCTNSSQRSLATIKTSSAPTGQKGVVQLTESRGRRRLSAEGYAAARNDGLRHLERMREIHAASSGTANLHDSGVEFVGDRFVAVYYMEEGHIYQVSVDKEPQNNLVSPEDE